MKRTHTQCASYSRTIGLLTLLALTALACALLLVPGKLLACCGGGGAAGASGGGGSDPCGDVAKVKVHWSVSNLTFLSSDPDSLPLPQDTATVYVDGLAVVIGQQCVAGYGCFDCVPPEPDDGRPRCARDPSLVEEYNPGPCYFLSGEVEVPLGSSISVDTNASDGADALSITLRWDCPATPTELTDFGSISATIPDVERNAGEGGGSLRCQQTSAGASNEAPGNAGPTTVAAMHYEFGLGRASDGSSPAGSIKITQATFNASSYTAAALKYQPYGTEVIFQPGAPGVIWQVRSGDGLAEVDDALPDDGFFLIYFYTAENNIQRGVGSYTHNGPAKVTWRIENPNQATQDPFGPFTQMKITEQRGVLTRFTYFTHYTDAYSPG